MCGVSCGHGATRTRSEPPRRRRESELLSQRVCRGFGVLEMARRGPRFRDSGPRAPSGRAASMMLGRSRRTSRPQTPASSSTGQAKLHGRAVVQRSAARRVPMPRRLAGETVAVGWRVVDGASARPGRLPPVAGFWLTRRAGSPSSGRRRRSTPVASGCVSARASSASRCGHARSPSGSASPGLAPTSASERDAFKGCATAKARARCVLPCCSRANVPSEISQCSAESGSQLNPTHASHGCRRRRARPVRRSRP